jgi:hypothetical protein
MSKIIRADTILKLMWFPRMEELKPVLLKIYSRPSVVAYAFNLSTWEAEA